MSDYWSWANSPLMQMDTWGQQAPQSQPGYDNSAQGAAEAAAARIRRQAGYRGQFSPEQQQDYQGRVADVGTGVAGMLNPFLGAGLNAAQGEWGNAGIDTAAGALPYIGRFLKPFMRPAAGAAVMQPTSAGEAEAGPKQASATPPTSSPFGFITDPNERASYEAQLTSLGPKGRSDLIRQVQDQYNTKKLDAEKQQSDAAGYVQWLKDNEGSIKSLHPSWQQKITAAGNQQQSDAMLQSALQEKINANKTFGERNPQTMEKLQEGSALASALLPAALHIRAGSQGRTVPLSHMIGGTALDAAIPSAAGVVMPNAIDVATSERGSDLRNKAWTELSDPMNYGRSALEGIAGAATGTAVGKGIRHAIWGLPTKEAGALTQAATPSVQAVTNPGALSGWSTPKVREYTGIVKTKMMAKYAKKKPSASDE